jgi:hypothetical protein
MRLRRAASFRRVIATIRCEIVVRFGSAPGSHIQRLNIYDFVTAGAALKEAFSILFENPAFYSYSYRKISHKSFWLSSFG